MDVNTYNGLSLGQKASLLWQSANYIDRHIDGEKTSSLYHINNFYVEAIVSHMENRIVEVTPLIGDERLDKYIHQVNLAALML